MTIGIFISLTTSCATQPFVTNTDILAQDGDYQRLSQQYPDFAKREHRFKHWKCIAARGGTPALYAERSRQEKEARLRRSIIRN